MALPTPNSSAADLAVVFRADTSELRRAMGRAGRAVARADLQVARATRRMQDQFAATGASATRMGGRFSRVFTGRMGNQIQNVGFQVGDFATQVSSGTSAMRAFSMQAPQLLGAFGPVGSLLGVVAGVAGTLAVNLFNSADAAEQGTDDFQSFGDAVSTVESSVSGLVSTLENQIEAIEDAADAQTASTDSIIADLDREFAVKRELANLDILDARRELDREKERLEGLKEELEKRKELERIANSDNSAAVGAARSLRERRDLPLGPNGETMTDEELSVAIERGYYQLELDMSELERQSEALQDAVEANTRATEENTSKKEEDDDDKDDDGGDGGGGGSDDSPGAPAFGPYGGGEEGPTPGFGTGTELRDRDSDNLNPEKIKTASEEVADAFEKAVDAALFTADSFEEAGEAFLNTLSRIARNRAADAASGLFEQLLGAGAGALTNAIGGTGAASFADVGLPSQNIGGMAVPKMPAAATGGTFKVAGQGSTDSKIASMRVSPGELVKVQQPARAGGDGGPNVTYNIDARGADAGAVQRIEGALQQHVANHASQVANDVRQGRNERTLPRGRR